MEETKTIPSATEPQDLFTEKEFITYTEASTSQRFVNYFIDSLFMQYAVAFGTTFLLAKVLITASPDAFYSFFGEGDDMPLLTTYAIALLNHLLYYTICEKAFRGHTLGKLVTGTRVIREDGEELTFKDALLRSLCRLVPFETISIWFGGGGPWHDTWTKTKVIKTR
jgi:uncharacterized RDD family membrane protein YckC